MNKLIRIKKCLTRTSSGKFSFLIFVFLTISLIFFGYYLFAQVEETPTVLKDYLKAGACPTFADINELTMKDQCTGLVWARNELPTFKQTDDTSPGYSWQEAKTACENLAQSGGSNLFRLPTVEELLSMIKYKCDGTSCQAKGDIAEIDSLLPAFANGIYWTSSDFHEPETDTNVNSNPPGNIGRDYKRSVSLLTGVVDSPVFGQNIRLNAWCIVERNPGVVEKKFTATTTSGGQVTGGTLKTIYHRTCSDPSECSIIGATDCEGGGGGIESIILCGDGVCNGTEDCSTCPADCGDCVAAPVCGNGSCESAENCSSCPADCVCPPVTSLSCDQPSGSATIAADNCFLAYLNGTEIGRSPSFPSSSITVPDITGAPFNTGPESCNSAWYTPYTYNNLPYITGPNVIAIEATDFGGPYGLAAQFMCGTSGTDKFLNTSTPVNWKCSAPLARILNGTNDPTDSTGKKWYEIGFDDSAWTAP
ncbi:MAG: DUF1566 domain-containing protein, partial [Candidatus Parcubacteria bacterium]|nr:DUF1566 domain-containing protein [Candidatus Parcubacteria bacterium]